MGKAKEIKDVRVRYNPDMDTIYIEAIVPESFHVETEVNEPLDDVFSSEDSNGVVYAVEVLNFNKMYPQFRHLLDVPNINDFLGPFLDKVKNEIKKETK
jgi:uncharacterized protein YuzE